MSRVYDNWERLVRATLRSEQLRSTGQGHERTSSGIAGSVPDSLQKTTNINAILQAADEIQAEDPNVARILCEQAYSMAQNLDPNSDGRGVLQFKTGLMSVIKQKLAKRDGARIDRNLDAERLWEFYLQYKRRHRVDDIQREEQRLRESGTFSANLGDLGLRSIETKKVFATLRALVEVMESLGKDAGPDGVGRLIMEELRRIKKSDPTLSVEFTPYNIVPLEASSITNAIGFFPEILNQAGVGVLLSNMGISSDSASFLISGLTTLLMIPSIGVAMRLMDIAGKRKLLLGTLPVLLASLVILVLGNIIPMGSVIHAIISTVCVVIYFCCFVMGFGPIPNILCSEIFPTRVRGLCIAITALTFWFGDIIVTYSLPVMLTSIGLVGFFGFYAVV